MTRLSLLTTSTILTFALGSTAWAQTTHPVTGETLAEDQTFQYRLLDQFPSIDPQLIEETAGGHVARYLQYERGRRPRCAERKCINVSRR